MKILLISRPPALNGSWGLRPQAPGKGLRPSAHPLYEGLGVRAQAPGNANMPLCTPLQE